MNNTDTTTDLPDTPPAFVTPPWIAMMQAHADQAESDPRHSLPTRTA